MSTPEVVILELESKPEISLETALGYAVRYSEYMYFESDSATRREAQKLFISDTSYVPTYEYPKLRSYADNDSEAVGPNDMVLGALIDEKRRLRACISTIQTHSAEIGNDVADLYIERLETDLKRQYLLEAAAESLRAGNAEKRALWRNVFNRLNEEIFGEIETVEFMQLMSEEKKRIVEHVPKSQLAEKIRTELLEIFELIPDAQERETLLDEETIEWYQALIKEKYPYLYTVIPDTDDSVIYSTVECTEIMNNVLAANGLQKAGWKVIIDPKKTIVSTGYVRKVIELPENTNRTANQLRKLCLHEIEVHAVRAYNGSLTNVSPLEHGTADYRDVEEGLAVMLECILDGDFEGPAITRARDRYIAFGLAMGVDAEGRSSGRDARETFEIMWRILALRKDAISPLTNEDIALAKFNPAVSNSCATAHIDNIYRGTDFVGRGTIYSKAKLYWEGFIKNAKLLRSIKGDKKRFESLFVAKHDHTNKGEVSTVQRIVQERIAN